MLLELARREKLAGIKPDEDLDIFMKVLALVILYQTFFSPSTLSLLGFDYFYNFSLVISFGGTGDKPSGGVHHEGILEMLITFFVYSKPAAVIVFEIPLADTNFSQTQK